MYDQKPISIKYRNLTNILNSMLEQFGQTNQKQHRSSYTSVQHIPKGCFDPEHIQKFISIKNFLNIQDMYNIVAPFRYQFLSYVAVKDNDPLLGQVINLYHEASRKCILKAVPKNSQIGCKYLIYCHLTGKIVSRIRGDLLSNNFFVFDGGNNPSKNLSPKRKQLAHIYMKNSQFFSQKPPSLTAILPSHSRRSTKNDQMQNLGVLFEPQGVEQIDQSISQLKKYQKQSNKSIFIINSVQPVYCPNKKGYLMDLKGLITQPSPINMVLKTTNNQDCLVMGKRSKKTYSLFVGNPLTLLQGFGIFLANFNTRKQ